MTWLCCVLGRGYAALMRGEADELPFLYISLPSSVKISSSQNGSFNKFSPIHILPTPFLLIGL
jgi:hypothetical protein